MLVQCRFETSSDTKLDQSISDANDRRELQDRREGGGGGGGCAMGASESPTSLGSPLIVKKKSK